MKKLISIVIFTVALFGWETTTHRAIDREAIKSSDNLSKFIEHSKIDIRYVYINEEFEGYDKSYFDYITKGENNGISKWNQTFSGDNNIWDAIEAGTILEDAQWPHWLDGGEYNYYDIGDGRFNNHFANPQNNYKKLWLGGKSALTKSALVWATDVESNKYDYKDALDYFVKGFTSTTLDNLSSSTPKQRKKYQAKMFVAIGHIMHLMNDMNVPAHTRDDAHPKGDALEWWARGGESGSLILFIKRDVV